MTKSPFCKKEELCSMEDSLKSSTKFNPKYPISSGRTKMEKSSSSHKPAEFS